MLNKLQNCVTGVSANRIKVKCKHHKELKKLQEQKGESCEEGGPFPSHKIPQGKK